MSYKLRSRKSTSDTLDNLSMSTSSDRLAAPVTLPESLMKPIDENCHNSDYLAKLLKVYEDQIQMLKDEMNRKDDMIFDLRQVKLIFSLAGLYENDDAGCGVLFYFSMIF